MVVFHRRAKRLKIEEQELKLTPVTALDACDVRLQRPVAARRPLPGAPPAAWASALLILGARITAPAAAAPPQSIQVRERDWSNVITAHEGDTRAYVWRLQRYTLGEWVLFPPGHGLGDLVHSICDRAGVVPREAVYTGQADAAVRLAATGLGVAIVPANIVPSSLSRHALPLRPPVHRPLAVFTRGTWSPQAEAFRDALMEGNSKAQSDYNRAAIGGPGTGPGWMTVDEVRKTKHLPPLGGDAAKLFYPPANTKAQGALPRKDSPIKKAWASPSGRG